MFDGFSFAPRMAHDLVRLVSDVRSFQPTDGSPPYPLRKGYIAKKLCDQGDETEIMFATKLRDQHGLGYNIQEGTIARVQCKEVGGKFYKGRIWYSPVFGLPCWQLWQMRALWGDVLIPGRDEDVPYWMTPLMCGYYLKLDEDDGKNKL